MKKLIVFDLDGTLTESKQDLDTEMADLLIKLLSVTNVGITGGGSYTQFTKQLLSYLPDSPILSKLLIFPTNGAFLYRYKNGLWQPEYSHLLSEDNKKRIISAFDQAFKELRYQNPAKTYGPTLEDRGSQITFSALGQKAPLEARENWKATSDRRIEIKNALEKYLPDFDIVVAGVTSIDVIAKNINKGMAIDYAQDLLHLPDSDVVFVGDSLFIGGNDYLARRSGVDTINVSGPSETKDIIIRWLNENVKPI